MDYFTPGIRAFRRFAARLEHRSRLYFALRTLAKAETELGLLGWQQAEFDAVTQRQVEALQNVEREQAELYNRSAEIARGLAQVADERAALREVHEKDHAALESERIKLREPLAGYRDQIEKLRDVAPAAERRMAELEKELREIEIIYNKLLIIQPQTAEVRDEILGLRDQLIAIPNERNDLRSQTARRNAEIQQREDQIATIEKQVAELDRGIRERKATYHKDDEALARKQRDLERDKARAEAEHDQLERAKVNPYREIGIVLADNNVAPMNQPHALDRVVQCRAAVAAQDQTLAEIAARAAAEDPITVRMSLAVWGAIFLALALIVTALW
jgi:chromosome segregation ATPase